MITCGLSLWRRTLIISSVAIFTTLCLFFSLSEDPEIAFLRLRQILPQTADRITNWDWKYTDEEIFCRNRNVVDNRNLAVNASTADHKEPIPNVAHFVLLSSEGELYQMTYPRYLSIKAAILRLNATEIKIHIYENGLDTDNRWWHQLANHVTLVPEARLQFGPHGLSIQSVRLEHQSDLVRLAVLAREGGIYLDTDIYVLKPFTDLLSSPRDVLMGHEGGNRYGLCNAVIISRPKSAFISKWRASYRTFDPKGWNQHSVQKPKQLQVCHSRLAIDFCLINADMIIKVQFPELICPLSPAVFFWPTWVKKHISYMHEPISQDDKYLLQANMTAFDGAMYKDQLVVHAWGREARDYLSVLSPETIRNDTRFNVLIRDIAMAEL